MTVVSVKCAPADPAVPANAVGSVTGSAAPSAGGDFLAAMLEALGSSADGSESPTADPNTPDDRDTPDAAVDASALALVATSLLLPAPVAPLPSGEAGVALAQGHANVAGATAVSPTGPEGDIRMSAYEAGPSPTATGDTGAVATSPKTPAAQTTDLPAPGPASRSTDDAVESAEPRTPDPAGPWTGSNDPVAAPDALSSATGSSSSPVSAPVVPATPSPRDVTPALHVTRQVIPEVTGLVSRGDGTHRITLALRPEALGEVRVVMTVRDGSVHVRLAAGQEAQRALLEGSPELTRLLDAAGVSDTRVTVRDLSTGAPATSIGSSSGDAQDLGAGGSAAQDQHAGTRAQHPATDGTHDGSRHRRAAAGANPPRSNEPVTRTRTAGVDVTM